ncbi:MAG: cytochrome c [Gemmatimonadaceae bacterium]|jgi:mono/diheme cytochrome c family protein
MTFLTSLPSAGFATVVLLATLNVARPALSPLTPSSSSVVRATPVAHADRARVARVARDTTPLYTDAQATAGLAVFTKNCAECHEKKDVTSADFRTKWSGRTLFDLYELVRTTMPDSNPGALSRDEYAAAIAYILKLNGLPAGPATVMPDSAAMRAVTLALPPQSP